MRESSTAQAVVRSVSSRRVRAASAAVLSAAAGVSSVAFTQEQDSSANPGAYFPGSGGMLFTSGWKSFTGAQYVSTNNCGDLNRAAMTTAWSNIRNATDGSAEMTEWPHGIYINTYRCNGEWNNSVDFMIWYGSNPPGAGGQNYPAMADSKYCAYWGVSHPCGRRDTLDINQASIDTGSPAQKNRLLIHEVGHPNSLHDCAHGVIDSVMNNGSGACPWWDIGQIAWKAFDRNDVAAVYGK